MRTLWKRGLALILTLAILPYDCLNPGMSQTVYAAEETEQIPAEPETPEVEQEGPFRAEMQENADVLMEWEPVEGGVNYSLYRDDIVLYQTQPGEEKWVYCDMQTEAGESYHYYLVVTNETGEEVYHSDDVELTIPEVLTIEKDFTLTEDMTVYSVTVTGGTVNLNGHTLQVCKDYSQSAGKLKFSQGLLYCYENFRLSGGVDVSMEHPNDYLYVGKTVFWDADGYSSLTDGTIEAAGNFYVYSRARFCASGSHKTIFSGTRKQVISIGQKNNFNIVELTNRSEKGVRSAYNINYNTLIRNGHDIYIGDSEPAYGFTLTEDTELYGDFYMTADTMDLNGYTLTINGDLIQAGGFMKINGGRLIVNGDYRLETRKLTADGYQYGDSNATLLMQNEADYIRVVGNLTDSSTIDHTGKLTEGTMEVLGDVTVNGAKSYMPGDEHILILSGNGAQTITMPVENGTKPESCAHLSNVEIQNESKDGVTFAGDPYVSGCMADNHNQINGVISVGDHTQFIEGYFGGSIKTISTTEWEEDLTIGGDLVVDASLSVASHVIVMGDVEGGNKNGGKSLTLSQGSLEVYGNMNLGDSGTLLNMTHETDECYVHGDLTYKPYWCEEPVLTAGVIRVEGDLTLGDQVRAADTHRIILCGESLQTLCIAEQAHLAIVELQNYSQQGVFSETMFAAERVETNDCILTYREISTPKEEEKNEADVILTEDMEWSEDYYLREGTLDLNGHTLTIHGNLIQSAGMMYVHGGTLCIDGDYRIQTEKEDGSYGAGSGVLRMTEETDHVQVKGDFITESDQDHRGYLTAGTLELWGDLTVCGEESMINFCATGNHKILLTGDQDQRISFTNTYVYWDLCTRINDIEADKSAGAVVFEGDPYVAHHITDPGKVMKGDLYVGPDTVFEDGYFGGNVTLREDTVWDQDLTIEGNVNNICHLQIAAHIVIKGGFQHEVDVGGMGGLVEMMHGSLEVYGDMVIGYNWYNNGLHMEHEDDEIRVYGTCCFCTANDVRISAGTLWIAGDFMAYYPFQTGENHTTIFGGDQKQTVALCDELCLGKVELRNYSTEGVDIAGTFDYKSLIRNGCRLTYGGIEGVCGWTLEEDMVWEGDLTLVDDTLDLNGHILKVKGNLLQPGGEVYIHGGRLEVDGDYLIQEVKTEGFYTDCRSLGKLVMTDESDYVLVQGSFVMDTRADTQGKMTAGTLEVKGDFRADCMIDSYLMEVQGFCATEDHRVLLSGNDKQCVETNSSDYCQFANVEIMNESDAGVEFDRTPFVANLMNDHGNHVQGSIGVGTTTHFAENRFRGSITIKEDYTIEEELDIRGDVTVEAPLQINGTLLVAGDLSRKSEGKVAGQGTVVFCGDDLQEIDLGYYGSLPHVVLENQSKEGVHTDYVIDYLSMERNGCRFSIGTDQPGYGMTLDSDYVSEGNLVLTEGTLDLNGHTLTVNGDLIHQSGDVYIHGGSLVVKGDYIMRVRNRSWSTSYSSSNGRILMDESEDAIQISGDFIISTLADLEETMTAGTLYVSGDVIQKSHAFRTGADLTMVLCGNQPQSLEGYYRMQVGTLVNASEGGCSLDTDIRVQSCVEDKTGNVSGDGRVFLTAAACSEPVSWSGNLAFGEPLTLETDVCAGDTIYVVGEVSCGEQKIETENLVVTGTLHVQNARISCSENLSVTGQGALVMQDPQGSVVVNGTTSFDTARSHAGLLTNGTLELKGDFCQSKAENFIAGGDHTTILANQKAVTGRDYRQIVSFENGAGTTRFHRLIIRKKENSYQITPSVELIADEVIYENQDVMEPQPVSYLKKAGVSATTVTLSYGGTQDESGIGGYEIYRDGVRIGVTSQNTYTDSGLTVQQEYTYQVYPYDREGNIAKTSPELVVTTLADVVAPETPGQPWVSRRSGSAITLAWEASSDNVAVAGYRVYRDGELVADVTEENSYKDAGLEQNREYTYQVSAYDTAGNESSWSVERQAATVMPQILEVSPTDQQRILTSQVDITVTWKDNQNGNGSAVKLEYKNGNVWQDMTPGLLSGKKTGSCYQASWQWDVSELERDRDYPIRITLYDADGNTDMRQITCRIVREVIQPPAYVKAVADEGVIRLTWESSSNVECSGYRIYRAVGNGNTYSLIREIRDVAACEYMDTDVADQTVYHYQISSISDLQGESPRSDAVEVTADADTIAPVVSSMTPQAGRVNGKTTLTAIATDQKGVSHIRFEYRTTEDPAWTVIADAPSTGGWGDCSWDTTALADGTYTVRAIAVDAAGNESSGAVTRRYEVDYTGCTQVKISGHEETATAVMLHWEDIADPDFGYFQVEKHTEKGFVALGRTSTELGYLAENCKPETEYTFRVVAYDDLGNRGEPSEEVTVCTSSDESGPVICSVGPAESRYGSVLRLQMQAEDNDTMDRGVFSYSLDGENYTLLAEVEGTKTAQASYHYDMDISGFTDGTMYVKFEAYDISGNKNAPLSDGTDVIVSYIIDHTAPQSPKNLSSTDVNGCVGLTWDKPGETDVSAYRIYRADYDTGIFHEIEEAWQNIGYYDTAVEFGKSYRYKIAAVDVAGNVSDETEEISVTVQTDEEKPQITGVTPEGGSTVGACPAIRAWVMRWT